MSAVTSVKAWIERRPKQAVLVAAVIAVLIGAQLGFLGGYKFEHDRAAKDIAHAKKTAAAGAKNSPTTKTGTGKGGAKGSGPSRRDGTVTAATSGSITIKTKLGASVTLTLASTTLVDKMTAGKAADIAVGKHVLVVPPGKEVLVLRADATVGRTVTTSTVLGFKLGAAGGLPASTIKMTKTTTVDSVSPATAADVKTGDHIIVFGSGPAAGPLKAVQIIVLSPTSKFVG